jgi:hypothetical protein
MTTSLSGRRQQARVGGAAINAAIDAGLAAEKAKWDDINARARAARDAEKARPKLTRDDILGATAIRDQFGWRRVLKVNAKSVTVPSTLHPDWTDLVSFDKVREVRR